MRRFLLVPALALLTFCSSHASPVPVTPAVAAASPVLVEPPFVRSPAAFTALLTEYDRLGRPASMHAALDRMAAQRDAHASRLYWYTDLAEAEAEAKRTGRPILSLRLLGRLDEEMSCANSRLFRVMLYANASVSQFLRDHYVLHWSSERAVPEITLDFGDGRVVKRTITGNSIHYVLDAQGRVVDALPGLYGPAAFVRGLNESLELAKTTGSMTDDDATKAVRTYHTRAIWRRTAQWRALLRKAYETYPEYVDKATLPSLATFGAWPDPLYSSLTAQQVNELTYSKADMEEPSLQLLQPQVTAVGEWGDWSKLGSHVLVDRIDDGSRALLREKRPRDWHTASATALDDNQLDKRVALFEGRMSVEALRNEYVMHSELHRYLARPAAKRDFASVDEFVYSRVFLTPKSDAWLGLRPTEAITALPDDGLQAAR